ncbi:MAG: hypothetical protein IIY78_09510 [Clostridia bacterium]|nr:hypothetical protein [Clostridia bacterium]
MNKKLIAVLMAALFAVLLTFPVSADDGTQTLSRSYTAGYVVLNYNYFFTGNLTRLTDYSWLYATDDNIETVFVKSSGVTYTGFHKTSVYSGTTQICDQVQVDSGASVNFTIPSAYINAINIKLRIANGATNGDGYRTRGTFYGVLVVHDITPYDGISGEQS